MRLENKIALVTGGGQGIGKEIAKTLALNGAFVLINYIDLGNNQEIAQMTKNEIESLGGKCEILPANVASYDETLEMFKTIKNEYGRLDILINNAGITKDGLMLRMKENDFDAVIDVNLKGTWNCMKHATKLMMKQKYGRIVSMSSVVGVMGNAGQVNYAASKSGIIGMTMSLAREAVSYTHLDVYKRQEYYQHLSPYDHVYLARKSTRPNIKDYINHLFDDFIELHGDRLAKDDGSIVGGIGLLDVYKRQQLL